jgi:hypothetical protein
MKIEVGKTYALHNGNRITVTNIGTRSFDGMRLISYRVEGEFHSNGLPVIGDSTPNSLHYQIHGEV